MNRNLNESLFTAGSHQSFNPKFTAEKILGITDIKPFPIVQELGFANISVGIYGISVMFNSLWILTAS